MAALSDDDRLLIWLSRHISRQDAEQALAYQPDGTYLVRASVSAPGDYVLSMISQGKVHHHQIKHNNGRMLTRSGKELRSLSELVNYYKENLDGLDILLGDGVRTFDPPRQPPRGYVNLVHQAQANTRPSSGKAAPPPAPAVDSKPVQPSPSGYVNLAEGELPPMPGLEDLAPFEIDPARLQIISELGSGHFGQVFEAWLGADVEAEGNPSRRKGKLVAVKSLKAGSDIKATQDFFSEAQILSQFSHPNVLGLLAVVTRRQPLQMVVEHVPYGDVRAVLKTCRGAGIELRQQELIYIAAQVASGMEHLAALKFVHRDLAARNVLLGRYCHAKIADFGLSRALTNESEYYVVQSRSLLPFRWMSVEALLEGKFTTQSDVWAFGVTLWEIMSLAKTPWRKCSSSDVKKRVVAGEMLPVPKRCDPAVYQIMVDCWRASPIKRPSFAELRAELESMFEKTSSEKPRDIGQLVPKDSATPSSSAFKIDSELDSQQSSMIEKLEVPRDELRFVKELGSGDFYDLSLMEMSSGLTSGARQLVAVKHLRENASTADKEAFESEIKLRTTQLIDHENVVALLGVCTQDEPTFLLMEYLSLGDLHTYLIQSAPTPDFRAQVTTEDLTNMAGHVAAGMAYLSSQGVVHRDVAARNCLVGNGPVAKISNFGLGKTLHGNDYYSSSGGVLPVRWMAPEAVCFGKYSTASDVWSYAILLAEMYTYGQRPFNDMSDLEICNAYASGSMHALPVPDNAPDVIVECMQRCLKADVEDRCTFQELDELLRSAAATAAPQESETPTRQVSAVTAADIDWKNGIGEIVWSGWLTKQGKGDGAFGRQSWKKRWFVLRNNGSLTYHKTQRPDAKPLNLIDLKQALQVKECPAFEPAYVSKACFTLKVTDRVYSLVSDSVEDRATWIEFFGSAMQALHS